MDLDELRAFVAVVDRGSLAAASKSLRFPIATLRRRLDELESRMGVKLLERSRLGATPTGAGSALVERARGVLSEVQSLADVVRRSGAEPTGEIHVAVQQGLPPDVIAGFFHLMPTLYPKLSWRVQFVRDPLRALSLDMHAAICMGSHKPDGPWPVHKLLTVPHRLVANPKYLDRHGTPASVAELARHRLLTWEGPDHAGDSLPLLDGSTVSISPWLRMSDIYMLRRTAALGDGIAFAPDAPGLRAAEGLVPVLEDVVGSRVSCWMVAQTTLWDSPAMRTGFEQIARIASFLDGA